MSQYKFDNIIMLDLPYSNHYVAMCEWCKEFVGPGWYDDTDELKKWASSSVSYRSDDEELRMQLVMQFARKEDATMFALRWS